MVPGDVKKTVQSIDTTYSFADVDGGNGKMKLLASCACVWTTSIPAKHVGTVGHGGGGTTNI